MAAAIVVEVPCKVGTYHISIQKGALWLDVGTKTRVTHHGHMLSIRAMVDIHAPHETRTIQIVAHGEEIPGHDALTAAISYLGTVDVDFFPFSFSIYREDAYSRKEQPSNVLMPCRS